MIEILLQKVAYLTINGHNIVKPLRIEIMPFTNITCDIRSPEHCRPLSSLWTQSWVYLILFSLKWFCITINIFALLLGRCYDTSPMIWAALAHLEHVPNFLILGILRTSQHSLPQFYFILFYFAYSSYSLCQCHSNYTVTRMNSWRYEDSCILYTPEWFQRQNNTIEYP